VRAHVEPAAEQGHAFPDAGDPAAAAGRAGPVGQRVDHLDGDLLRDRQPQRDRPRPAVPGGVRQSLLHDAVGLPGQRRRQLGRRRYLGPQVGARGADVGAEPVQVGERRPGRSRIRRPGAGPLPTVRLVGVPEHTEHVVEVVHRGAAHLLDRGQGPPGELRIAVEDPPRRPGLQRRRGQRMPDRIVQVPGQPVALGEEPLPRRDRGEPPGRRRPEQHRRHRGRERAQAGRRVPGPGQQQHPGGGPPPAVARAQQPETVERTAGQSEPFGKGHQRQRYGDQQPRRDHPAHGQVHREPQRRPQPRLAFDRRPRVVRWQVGTEQRPGRRDLQVPGAGQERRHGHDHRRRHRDQHRGPPVLRVGPDRPDQQHAQQHVRQQDDRAQQQVDGPPVGAGPDQRTQQQGHHGSPPRMGNQSSRSG